MIGVFLSFTLSQTGMFLRARRLREPGWKVSAGISGFGAFLTFIVLIVVAITKGAEGAWIVLILIPVLVMVFKATRHHYDNVANQLSLTGVEVDTTPHGHIVIVPIGGVHRAVIEALRYASALSKDVRAVYVNVNQESLAALKRDWPQWGSHVKLVVLQSPFRSMTEPLLEYIDRQEREHPDDYITVVLPEFVVKHWWHNLLHNQSALTLKAALLFRPTGRLDVSAVSSDEVIEVTNNKGGHLSASSVVFVCNLLFVISCSRRPRPPSRASARR